MVECPSENRQSVRQEALATEHRYWLLEWSDIDIAVPRLVDERAGGRLRVVDIGTPVVLAYIHWPVTVDTAGIEVAGLCLASAAQCYFPCDIRDTGALRDSLDRYKARYIQQVSVSDVVDRDHCKGLRCSHRNTGSEKPVGAGDTVA